MHHRECLSKNPVAMYKTLVPSVQRRTSSGEHDEQYITTNFMIQTRRLNSEAPQPYDRASWLTMMQHYGLPTRLLDWSESPLVTLYFALSEKKDDIDAAVWIMNPMKLNKKVGYGEYVPPIDYKSLSGDLEGAFSEQTDVEKNEIVRRIVACHGIGSDLRMYVQQSDFTLHSSNESGFSCKISGSSHGTSFAYYMCVVGTGKSCSFEKGYHQISDIIQLEKYQFLFQCAKESNDFDFFMKSVA